MIFQWIMLMMKVHPGSRVQALENCTYGQSKGVQTKVRIFKINIPIWLRFLRS